MDMPIANKQHFSQNNCLKFGAIDAPTVCITTKFICKLKIEIYWKIFFSLLYCIRYGAALFCTLTILEYSTLGSAVLEY